MAESSYKRLTLAQRKEIKSLKTQGLSIGKIASTLGVSRSTIHYELNRPMPNNQEYDPVYADAQSREKQKRNKSEPILLSNPALAKEIADMILNLNYSPEQVFEELRAKNETLSAPVSIPTIYRAIDSGYIPGVSRKTLQKNVTTMFSNGLICIPKWLREELDFHDGDSFSFTLSNDGSISIRKQPRK